MASFHFTFSFGIIVKTFKLLKKNELIGCLKTSKSMILKESFPYTASLRIRVWQAVRIESPFVLLSPNLNGICGEDVAQALQLHTSGVHAAFINLILFSFGHLFNL